MVDGYRALFRDNPSFRHLFTARNASLLGDWFNTLAVLALLRDLGDTSATSFGWVLICKMFPVLIASPLAGVTADRFDRRRVLILSDVARFFIVTTLLVTATWGGVGWIYTLVALQAAASAFFEPARTAMLPDLVKPEELTSANAVGAAAWSVMMALGSAAGGWVTEHYGWRAALVVDASTYLVSLVYLLKVIAPPQPPARARLPGIGAWLGLGDVVEGIRYTAGRPRVASLVMAKGGWTLAGGLTLILTTYGEQVYTFGGRPMLGVSVLYIARGVGTGVGPMLVRQWARGSPSAMERAIGLGYLWGATCYLAFSLVGHIAPAAAAVFLAHLGGATVFVFSTVRLQQLTPPEVRGRVFAAEQGFFTLVSSASTLVYGWMLDHHVLPLPLIARTVFPLLMLPAVLWWLRGRLWGWAGPEAEREAALTRHATQE